MIMISTATHTTQSQALTIIDDENMDKEYKKLTIDDTSQLKESEKESWEEKRGRNQEMEEDCVAIVPEDLDSTVQKIIIGQEQQQEISQQYRGDERGMY
ncbi:hypothetical protein KUTeg_000101 [Tegillarca granosa]|uniref:Uncharacterized protein n=1 Tax=Tegillarca granosa TaxID=220873 RepID=A0ABQ9G0Y9_TEGGR|nr:hypothetical protein KUTeg_000101 [Tegillarca granosa]